MINPTPRPEHWKQRECPEWSAQLANRQRRELQAQTEPTRWERLARFIFTRAELVIACVVFLCLEALTAAEMVRNQQWVSGAGVMLVFATVFGWAVWVCGGRKGAEAAGSEREERGR